jgi:hypothetical protein
MQPDIRRIVKRAPAGVRCNSISSPYYCQTLPGKPLTTLSRSLAVTIETVISRSGLGMLSDNKKEF